MNFFNWKFYLSFIISPLIAMNIASVMFFFLDERIKKLEVFYITLEELQSPLMFFLLLGGYMLYFIIVLIIFWISNAIEKNHLAIFCLVGVCLGWMIVYLPIALINGRVDTEMAGYSILYGALLSISFSLIYKASSKIDEKYL